jgi:LacI family transcriptional regulator
MTSSAKTDDDGPQPRLPPKLADVARAARVSPATASRVLNASDRVTDPELQRRVIAAARELGYVPNPHARALVMGATSTVGLIVHDIADPYFAAIAAGVIAEARVHGLLVTIASTLRDPGDEIRYLSVFRAQRARTVILGGSAFEDDAYRHRLAAELRGFQATGGRVACIGDHGPDHDTVLPPNHDGAAALARHLRERGHRRIAVVTGPASLTTVRQRLTGFTGALRGSGTEIAPVVEEEFSRDGGYRAGRRLVAGEKDATAIFAVSDVMAVGVLRALQEAGVRVPGQVALAGFDDIPVVSDLTPPLTTIRLPLHDMGRRALSLTATATDGHARRVTLPFELVPRASTAPCPSGR